MSGKKKLKKVKGGGSDFLTVTQRMLGEYPTEIDRAVGRRIPRHPGVAVVAAACHGELLLERA